MDAINYSDQTKSFISWLSRNIGGDEEKLKEMFEIDPPNSFLLVAWKISYSACYINDDPFETLDIDVISGELNIPNDTLKDYVKIAKNEFEERVAEVKRNWLEGEDDENIDESLISGTVKRENITKEEARISLIRRDMIMFYTIRRIACLTDRLADEVRAIIIQALEIAKEYDEKCLDEYGEIISERTSERFIGESTEDIHEILVLAGIINASEEEIGVIDGMDIEEDDTFGEISTEYEDLFDEPEDEDEDILKIFDEAEDDGVDEIDTEDEAADTVDATGEGTQHKWVTDAIGDDYKSWQGDKVTIDNLDEIGDMIYINAGTGTGKTYFVFNTLAKYARGEEGEIEGRILYLCNRAALKGEAEKLKTQAGATNVDIKTYQEVQRIIIRQSRYKVPNGKRTNYNRKRFQDLYNYKYIVADEIHYLLEDAGFNHEIFFVFRFLNEKNSQIKILISATGKYAVNYFSDRIKYRYNCEKDTSYMNLNFYVDDKQHDDDFPVRKIIEVLENSDTEKILYFVERKDRIKKIFDENEIIKENAYCMYSKDDDEKGIDNYNSECIQELDENVITFDKRVLVTTSYLSNGVTLRDENIKHIICDIKDVMTAIQCIGRKRPFDNNDTVDIYVKHHFIKEIMNDSDKVAEIFNPLLIFANSRDSFIKDYGYEVPYYLYVVDWPYDAIIRPNIPLLEKCFQTLIINGEMQDLNNVETVQAFEQKREFCDRFYAEVFSKYAGVSQYGWIEGEFKKEAKEKLLEFIETHLGEEMQAKSDEYEEFKELMKMIGYHKKIIDKGLALLGYYRKPEDRKEWQYSPDGTKKRTTRKYYTIYKLEKE